jgi:tRNA A-37 threonylcarbamoyl transferase component Bud32
MNSEIFKEIVKINLSDGWKGMAVRDGFGLKLIPDKLTENPEQIFKSDKFGNCAILKTISSDNGQIPLVVKKITANSGIKKLIDFFRGVKAVRNFKLALILKAKGIDTAEPVAAFWNNNENIYVTEYIPNSMSLYDVAWGKNSEITGNFTMRKAVIRQVAESIAKFHKAGFWHRDSKAGNFIIGKNKDGYTAKLIDLDGIKYNFGGCREKQIRTLANLAKSLTRFKNVNVSDFYRGFMIYCDEMGYTKEYSKSLFLKVKGVSIEMRLLSIIEDAEKFRKKCLKK